MNKPTPKPRLAITTIADQPLRGGAEIALAGQRVRCRHRILPYVPHVEGRMDELLLTRSFPVDRNTHRIQ